MKGKMLFKRKYFKKIFLNTCKTEISIFLISSQETLKKKFVQI